MLLALLETQLRKCEIPGPDFVVFDGGDEGSLQRTSAFPHNAARRKVMKVQREAIKAELLQSTGKTTPTKTAAERKGEEEEGR